MVLFIEVAHVGGGGTGEKSDLLSVRVYQTPTSVGLDNQVWRLGKRSRLMRPV